MADVGDALCVMMAGVGGAKDLKRWALFINKVQVELQRTWCWPDRQIRTYSKLARSATSSSLTPLLVRASQYHGHMYTCVCTL